MQHYGAGYTEALYYVFTHLPLIQESTWGVAYQVDPNDIMDVMAYLDRREKGGYVTKEILFYPRQDLQREPFHTLVYLGTEKNPFFLGPALIEDIARQVIKSRGPSGCNAEYVLNLAQAMREIAPSARDDHLYSLEKQITEIVACSGTRESSNNRRRDSQCTCELCHLVDKTNL